MKIVRGRIQRAGVEVTVAFIDTEGLFIDGINTTYLIPEQDQKESVDPIKEDDDEDDSEDEEVISPITDDNDVFDLNKLYFGFDTYTKLAASYELWDQLLLAANKFFLTLTEDELRKFCLFYIDARKTIDRDLVYGKIIEVATTIGNDFYDLAVDINLPDKIIYYVEHQSGIPIPQLAYAGTNEGRDRPELTFHKEEYYLLLAISVIAKILCPIWGDLISRISGSADKSTKQVDNEMKETHCMNVIEPFLSLERFRNIRNKLYNYVANTVNTAMNSSYATASFTATVGGVSKDRFHHIIFSTLIIKKYVTIDLYTPVDPDGRNGNITVWTWTCAKNSFHALQTALNKRCHIMPRVDIFDSQEYGNDDERRISHLEHGSHITEVTADMPSLIKFGVRMAIQRLCQAHNIPDLDYRASLSYYQQNPVQVTIFNKIFVGILLGNHIGGAQGLKYLDLDIFLELVTITQIYIASLPTITSDVVHLLTATLGDEEKSIPELSNINTMITMTAKQTSDYEQCESIFPYAIGNVSIKVTLKRLQDYIVKYPHFTNTSPLVCALLEQPPVQKGSVIMYESDVMQRCCEIILNIVDPKLANVIREKRFSFGV